MTSSSSAKAQDNMLKSQILTGHILEPRILSAFTSVGRESFVPQVLQGVAYIDKEIPIGDGRVLMEPLVFARLLKHAAIKADETVLDVGAASGYSAAVLSKLARKVVALEDNVALSTRARVLLASYSNIEWVQGALAQGVSKSSPYDVIIIEGATQIIPQTLADQLREGGRLLCVEAEADANVGIAGLGKLVEHTKIRGKLYKTVLCDANVPMLAQFAKPPAFAF